MMPLATVPAESGAPEGADAAAGGYALFDTAIGRCGIAWNRQGIAAALLPATRDDHLRARLQRRVPGAAECAPPAAVDEAIARITALLDGACDDLSDLPLDLAGIDPFDVRVYAVTRAIAPGDTLSYGEVAARIGDVQAAREVGQALGRNPFAPIVPCHRVLAAGGRLGGFSATGGVDTKRRLLLIEHRHRPRSGELFA